MNRLTSLLMEFSSRPDSLSNGDVSAYGRRPIVITIEDDRTLRPKFGYLSENGERAIFVELTHPEEMA